MTPSAASAAAVTLYVQISGAAVGAITTQAAADDFSAVLLPITIPAGSTAPVTVSATVNADTTTEGPEGFQAKLLDSGFVVVAGSNTITGTITEGVTSGKTYMLTKGLDNVPGTSGNDMIIGAIDTAATPNAELVTLSSSDIINGGAGTDTLKIAHSGAAATTTLGSLSNVEIVEVESSSSGGVTVNSTATTGVTNLNVTKAVSAVTATAAATTDVDVSVKGIAGTTVTVNGGKAVNVATTDAAAAIDVGAAGADVTGAVTITATGAAASNANAAVALGTIAVGGGSTINVTQKATSDASALVAGGTAVTHTQGAVTIDAASTTTTVTVKQDAAVTADSVAAKTGVAEVASVKFTALTAGSSVTVGSLVFTAAKALTATDVAQAFANLSPGAIKPAAAAGDTQGASVVANGVFTGALLAGWSSAAASGDTVVFTATTGAKDDLTATGATVTKTTDGVNAVAAKNVMGVVAGTVDITDGAALKTVTVDGYSAAGSNINGTGAALETLTLKNGGAFTVADTADTLALNLEKVGTSATAVNLVLTAAPTTLNVTTTGNVYTNLNANATKTLNVSGTGLFSTGTNTLGALETVKVTGTAGLTLAAGPAATITSVDTTATTGTVTTTIDGTKATYTGGAGVDNVTLATGTALTKAINLGAGDDTLVFDAAVTGSTATLSGGDGTDTLSMSTARADALDATKQTFYTNFERLLINDAAGNTTVDLANLGFTNYVTTTGTTGTLTLDKMANNGTVVLTTAPTTGVTVQITDAADTVKGTADVLNVVTQVISADIDFKTLTAADVETININADDTKLDDDGNGTNDPVEPATLTLVATKATKINVTGDSNLTLVNTGNIALTEIDASTLTGNLTATATGKNGTTIKAGLGNGVLTAGDSAGNTAQVSTLAFTDGAGALTMAAGDSISATINGTTVTQAFTTNFNTTIVELAKKIDDIGGDNTTYNTGDVAPGNVITITSLIAGTPFTADAVFTPAAVSSVTGVYAEGTENQVLDKDTITFTDNAAAGGAMAAGDQIVFTITPAVGAVTTVTQLFDTDFATTLGKMADQVIAAGYGATVTGGNAIEVTGKAGSGAIVLGGFTFTDANAAGAVTAAPAEGAVDFVADADTLNFTEVTAMGPDDTITISVTNGVSTYTTAAVAFTTNYATTQGAVATAVAGLNSGNSFTAAYNNGVLTVTDKVAGGSPITNIGLTFTNAAANSVTDVFATTTENVAAKADVLNGGAGNDTLKAGSNGAQLTGGDGNDLFVLKAASQEINTYSSIKDFTAGDLLELQVTAGTAATGYLKLSAALNEITAQFSNFVEAAIAQASAGQAIFFNYKGNGYVVIDNAETGGASATSFQNGVDAVIEVVGVNMDNTSFNATHGTVALI